MRYVCVSGLALLVSTVTGCSDPALAPDADVPASADASTADAAHASVDAGRPDGAPDRDGARDLYDAAPDSGRLDSGPSDVDAAFADAAPVALPDAPFDAGGAGCTEIVLPEITSDNMSVQPAGDGFLVYQFLGNGRDGTGFASGMEMYRGPMPPLGVAVPMNETCVSGGNCISFYVASADAHFAIERGVIAFSAWIGDAVAGEHSDLVLRETRMVPLGGGSFAEHLRPDGRCFRVSGRSFDTRTPGRACVGSSDCRGGLTCDADSLRCAPPECTESADCAAGEMCRSGTCLRTCRAGCLTGTTCESGGRTMHSPSGGWNACVRHGDGGRGSASTGGGVYTSCAPGLTPSPDTCQPGCDPEVAEPGCPAGLVCFPPGRCGTAFEPGPAIGEPCAATGDLCGLDVKAYRGECVPLFVHGGFERRCLRYCNPDAPSSCEAGELCSDEGFSFVCVPHA